MAGNEWLFATPTGAPVNPRTDYDEWKRLLKQAGLRDGRLHDARHTAATVLLILGVAERAVTGLMGWSNSSMATRYQHITDRVRHNKEQWHQRLALREKAMLLIAMSMGPREFVLPIERVPDWYGVSADSAQRGLTGATNAQPPSGPGSCHTGACRSDWHDS